VSKQKPVPVVTLTINPDDELLTTAQLADRLKLRVSTIYELRRSWRDDPLPGIRIGKVIRYHWPSVSAWLARRFDGKSGTR
jgi:hypothetical protein